MLSNAFPQHDVECVGKMHENDAIQAGEVVYLESNVDELRDLSVAIALRNTHRTGFHQHVGEMSTLEISIDPNGPWLAGKNNPSLQPQGFGAYF